MKKSLLALSLLFAVPFAASAAEGLSYNYVEGGYTATNIEGPDADGWALKGSVAVAPNFHLFADYSSQEVENVNVGFDQWRVGVGYNHELSPRVDLLTRVAYEKFKTDSFTSPAGFRQPSFSADGYSVEVGANSALTDRLNGYALAGYEDGDGYKGEFYGRLGAQVKFTPNWSASADVKLVDGDTQYFVGPRFNW